MSTKGDIKATIPKGCDNAILLRDLAALSGISERNTKREIMRLREQEQYNILSSSEGGYFFPTQDEEGAADTMRYVQMMTVQGIGRLKRRKAAMKWLKEYKQLSIREERQ